MDPLLLLMVKQRSREDTAPCDAVGEAGAVLCCAVHLDGDVLLAPSRETPRATTDRAPIPTYSTVGASSRSLVTSVCTKNAPGGL